MPEVAFVERNSYGRHIPKRKRVENETEKDCSMERPSAKVNSLTHTYSKCKELSTFASFNRLSFNDATQSSHRCYLSALFGPIGSDPMRSRPLGSDPIRSPKGLPKVSFGSELGRALDCVVMAPTDSLGSFQCSTPS